MDFSQSGIAGLPAVTADTLAAASLSHNQRDPRYAFDPRVLGWLREAVQEGDRINRNDPSYDAIERGQQYVMGQHASLSPEDAQQKWMPKIGLNESRKAMQAHVSALTDLRPTFGYKSTNPQWEFQQHLLNKLVVSWWISTMADLELGEVIKYAFAGGTGDCSLEWDPYTGDGGNNILKARDPRDTLPIRPSQHHNIQLWQGLTMREEQTVNVLRTMYPAYAELFRASSDSLLGSVAGKFRQVMARIITPAADTLSGLSQPTHTQRPRSGHVVLYRTYLADQSRNQTGRAIVMGDPTASWGYTVAPGKLLYPNKRLVVWTEECVLYDGPSTYWHGLYPLSRLRLWSLPWLMLGVPILNDLTPLQDGINETLQDLRLGIRQWLHRSVKFDRAAVSEQFMRLYDSRKPGARVKMNQFLEGGFEHIEGPNPQVLALGLEFLRELTAKFEKLSGTANLESLMQLRQLPSADTIQKYYEALTPEIRYEGRMVETFLRDMAEMVKVNIFQYMSAERRIAILGDAGLALQDFDYDPGKLVPAMKQFKETVDPASGLPTLQPDPQYVPELDESRPEHERAKHFHKLFVFVVAPNSLLAMNTQEQKMMRFQLARMGYYDFWSLHETMETPNVGTPPAIPLPPLQPPSPEEQLQAMLQAGATALGMPPVDPMTGAPMPPSKFIFDPATGQFLEIRVPMTVTERLMAQQMLGIGMTENPAGRKASGQQSPKQETKSDGQGGQRSTVTESAK